MSALHENTILGRINALLDVVKQAETAMDTTGSAAKDPGGYSGETSHPSGDVDGGVGPAPLGARAGENEADIKDTNPAATDAVPPDGNKDQDAATQNTSGTSPTETGGDPSVEDNYDGEVKDPGTTHPANADKIGDKYAAMSTLQLCKAAEAHCEQLLVKLANNAPVVTSQSREQPATQAAQAGYAAATRSLQKDAGYYEAAAEAIYRVRCEAERAADNVAAWAQKRAEFLLKGAEDMAPDPTQVGGDGGAPPDVAAAVQGDGGGAPTPEDLAAMMGGGGPGGDPGAGDPGAPPPGDGAGMPGGDGDADDAAISELINALAEKGISLDDLLEAAQGATGIKGASALSPTVRRMAEHMSKYASEAEFVHNLCVDAVQARNRGRIKIKRAAGPRQRAARDEIKNYLTELCGV